MKRRETARERDERLVAEAGPWMCSDWDPVMATANIGPSARDRADRAAVRILNRIAKSEGKP